MAGWPPGQVACVAARTYTGVAFISGHLEKEKHFDSQERVFFIGAIPSAMLMTRALFSRANVIRFSANSHTNIFVYLLLH